MIDIKATLNIRTPAGKFPPGSFVKVLAVARRQMAADTRSAFDRRADPVAWRPWLPRKGTYPWPLLQKTGRMRRRVVAAVAAARVTGNTLTVRLTDEVAGYHQRGTRTIAARRMVGVSLAVLNAVRRALRDEAVAVFRRRG